MHAKIENGVKALDGIDTESLKVLFNSSKVKVNFDEENYLLMILKMQLLS